ncbi:hypothetical protein [Candidatus Poriferisocius sp.]|uniref:hypothetical protein n=1 Tax=Candidatus Poriferisocius sp. TaxID=3101276 RepID=UPI003B020551
MSRRRASVAVLCAAAVLAAALAGSTAGATGGGSAGAYQPAAGFTDTEYSVPFYGTLWDDNDPILTPAAVATNGASYFAQVAMAGRDASSLDLSFAVEGQSAGPLHQACEPDEGCNEVTVQVTPEGVLYLYWPEGSQEVTVKNAYLGGFASRAVELSAADADSGLKVYREVAVDPPAEAADCEDYDGGTPEAFTCLFLRELLPPGQAAAADEAALRAKLPKLVQDSANYRLVFAEEFNGTPPSADANGCRDGMSTLDPAVWNYHNACDNVDSRGEPCGNVGDGGFTMGIFSSCGFGPVAGFLLGTRGHLHMKYGYIETQYTFNIDQWRDVYQNYNMILNVASGGLHYLRDQYGVEVESWEDYLKSSQVEIDIFESPSSPSAYRQFDIAHQYANWSGADNPTHLKPIRTLKYTQYCARPAFFWQRGIVYNPNGRCSDTDTFTVTKGLEWTPRGYRTYIWVHGLQNGLTLLPKNQITVQQKSRGTALVLGRNIKNRFFENLVPGDNSTLLEQVAVSHIPMPIFLNVWGWLVRPQEGELAKHPYIRKRMTFDYVRVWQPENHYADMEPVYQ